MPSRAELDPGCFAAHAPRAFVAAREMSDVRFRLAGEDLIELVGRTAAGGSVLALWRPEHRGRVNALLGASLIAGEPMVIEAEGVATARDAQALRLEMLFAPLIGPEGVADRFLGLCQPLAGSAHGPVAGLAILAVNGHAAGRAHLRLAPHRLRPSALRDGESVGIVERSELRGGLPGRDPESAAVFFRQRALAVQPHAVQAHLDAEVVGAFVQQIGGSGPCRGFVRRVNQVEGRHAIAIIVDEDLERGHLGHTPSDLSPHPDVGVHLMGPE
jgi:hypothetical protein